MLNDTLAWRLRSIPIHAKNWLASFSAGFVQPFGVTQVSHFPCKTCIAAFRVFVLYLGGKGCPGPIRRLVPGLWLIQAQA